MSEATLFRHLCRRAGLPMPEAEYRFHPTRKWRFDWAWPAARLALEVDGGVWLRGQGAHSRPQNIERDQEKHNAAAVLGWRILRVQPRALISLDTVRLLTDALRGDEGL